MTVWQRLLVALTVLGVGLFWTVIVRGVIDNVRAPDSDYAPRGGGWSGSVVEACQPDWDGGTHTFSPCP